MSPARINHNAHLTEIHRNLAAHSAGSSREIGQLSSGVRVNRASDDPASLDLADGIRSEVRTIAEGSRNIQQTFSLLQVAEGSLNKIADIVRRMQGLAMQAASSVFNNQDRLNINSEFAHLCKEIDRTAGSTTYNGRKLLTGGNTSLNLVSTAAAEAATTGTSEILVDDASAGTYTFVDNPGVDRISLGNGVQTQTLNISEHLEEGVVPDGEHVVVRFDRLGISVTLTGTGVRGAAGQYSNGDLDGHTLVVDESDSLTLQVGPSETSNDMSRIGISDMRAVGANLNLADISIVTLNDARNAVDRLSTALTAVTSERNRLGAFQNRLQLSIASSESVIERMQSTESEVREVDMARSITNLSRNQILSQMATSIAVEADADIDRILSLLS